MADGLALSVLHNVRVHVHGDADLTVPEDLHHDAGRDSGRREEGRRTVPSVMEPDDAKAGGLGDAGERAVDVPRLDLSPGALAVVAHYLDSWELAATSTKTFEWEGSEDASIVWSVLRTWYAIAEARAEIADEIGAAAVPAGAAVFEEELLGVMLRALAANPEVNGDPRERGKFKTPSLRNVAVTGPYMHNGVFKDLRTVILFYNKYNSKKKSRQINPESGERWAPPEVSDTIDMEKLETGPGLDDQRIDALVAFLKTLTDKRYEPLLGK